MSGTTSWGENDWALILGASSGFGEAAALELANLGLNICGVHLDRKSTQPNAERIVTQIRSLGREVLFFNANAADPEKRADILNALKQRSSWVLIDTPEALSISDASQLGAIADGILLVEWGDVVAATLGDHLEVRFVPDDPDQPEHRAIGVNAIGRAWGARWAGLEAALEPWTVRNDWC